MRRRVQDYHHSKFMIGDRVQAKYKGRNKWYKGKIAKVNHDGTYDVEYDDGDFERNVAAKNVEDISLSPRGVRLKHDIGARVEAKFRGKSKWYKGRITKHNPDETYNIEYDDGDTELV